MAKIIYLFKMYLLQEELNLSAQLLANIKELCIFYALIYVPAWMKSPLTSDAPINDILLLQQLREYHSINKTLAKVALEKFQCHLWYLGAELAGLAFFSNKVSPKQKFAMMKNLNKNTSDEHRPIKLYDTKNIRNIKLEKLINSNTMTTLNLIGEKAEIDELIATHPLEWKKLSCYQKLKARVESIKVISKIETKNNC
jgi:hypothetical protein